MQINSLSIDGLSALPHFEWRADSHSPRLNGPLPNVYAVRDGLVLAFSVFSTDRLNRLLEQWGWSPSDIVESDGRVVEAHWEHAPLAEQFVVEQPNPRIQFHIELALNASVLADLRRWTVRQPELQLALLESPTVRMSISCEFGQHRQFMRILVGGLFLGKEKIDLSTEPHWLPQLWQHMDAAFSIHDPRTDLAQQAAEAAFSVNGHGDYLNFVDSLPHLSPIRLIQSGTHWQFWVSEQPLRSFGEMGAQSIRHAALLYLSGASVVWLDGDTGCAEPKGVQVWGFSKSVPEFDFKKANSELLSFPKP
ncbi:MAG: hypothetical protein ACON4U_04845 [Myxococcota bacterium]